MNMASAAVDLPPLVDGLRRLVRHEDGWRLERTQIIARPLAEVWSFFERPENLEGITPGFLRFEILTPSPVPMHKDAWIDYRLKLHGIPVRWRTQITRHDPPRAFVDEQKSGPFARWIHLHEFRSHPRGTWMLDRVDYKEPLGPLGTIAHHLYTKDLVDRIFDHRREAVRRRLEGAAGS